MFNKNKGEQVECLNINDIKMIIRFLTKNHNRHFTSKDMILIVLLTGARLGEIMALTWDDINFNFKTISINKAWNYHEGGGFKETKTKSSNRTIRVDQQLLNILRELKQNDSQMVFTDQYGTIPSSTAVNKTLRTVLKSLGINRCGFHFHSLRHSHVAYLLANHMDIYAISKRLGHANVSTTIRVYAYLIEEYKAQTDNQIEDLLDNLFDNSPIPISQKTAIN
ncbi:site-specific integrase [Lentilactobacillus kisonensis]|uniref:Site-specific recombinase, phage integrase family n=1 Tax=Lentilactobacillus kisonensis F0435 TaxID=797516 RepID=H1LGX2_9LACO|nr:site-specific integrase [Lentilactobacillus kisonensis]EHO50752.1 site-specific recombinase, phage integrase family [Lentilactobacillus kisonensis F0435]